MFLPQTRNLVVADGQVGTVASAVLSGTRDAAPRYNFTFSNVGVNVETLVITFSRAGGTPRQVRQVVLDPDETFELCGLPCNKADSVYAVTSNASSVDYLVSTASEQTVLGSQVYDANGMPKSLPWVVEQLAAVLS